MVLSAADADPSEIVHESGAGRFVIRSPLGDARLEYRLQDECVVFTHTYVPSAMRGHGVAARLVEAGLRWAAEQDRRVETECSYV